MTRIGMSSDVEPHVVKKFTRVSDDLAGVHRTLRGVTELVTNAAGDFSELLSEGAGDFITSARGRVEAHQESADAVVTVTRLQRSALENLDARQ